VKKAESCTADTAVQILGLSKIYRKYPFVQSKKGQRTMNFIFSTIFIDIVAVSNMSLTCEKEEIVALLGVFLFFYFLFMFLYSIMEQEKQPRLTW